MKFDFVVSSKYLCIESAMYQAIQRAKVKRPSCRFQEKLKLMGISFTSIYNNGELDEGYKYHFEYTVTKLKGKSK